MKTLIITTLAEYQTNFWLEIAKTLRAQDFTISFISFDDRSSDTLRGNNFTTYSLNNSDRQRSKELTKNLDFSLKKYQIENLHHWLTHEKVCFNLNNTEEMIEKLFSYIALSDRCIKDNIDKKPIMLQELGGFISVIACFFSSRAHNVDNYFIEPSFFKGRMFFVKNSFSSIDIEKNNTQKTNQQEVERYLNDAIEKKTIVIPKKDKHHYSNTLAKIINKHNIKRAFEKAIDKFILKKHQEFGHLGHHIRKHIIMLINEIRLKSKYAEASSLEKFIYFPLHVPGDMALTLRSPKYLDQISLVNYIARNIPHGYKLAIKEHPAMIGAIDAREIKGALDKNDQLVIISPKENNYDIIKKCDCVISINSKSGAEATLLNKQVLLLGDAFYSNNPLTTYINDIKELHNSITISINKEKKDYQNLITDYFQDVWSQTYPGELYVSDKNNIDTFAKTIVSFLTRNK
ncbi:hypothetical protein IMCC1989_1764 [gamma proteobacterium IMCC1989]|nr:hypothetical protein IMCC1989_1764 [gamma proteobacterium IMCC1989]